MAVEEEENLEDDDEEDAATVRQLAGDDPMASIDRAMVSAIMLPLPRLLQPILVDVQRRRVLVDIVLSLFIIMVVVCCRSSCESL